MSNVKAQMSIQYQMRNVKNFVIWILSLICHLEFVIWNLRLFSIFSVAKISLLDKSKMLKYYE